MTMREGEEAPEGGSNGLEWLGGGRGEGVTKIAERNVCRGSKRGADFTKKKFL